MTQFRPKFITFDCYGTLTRFQMGDMARDIYADRVAPGRLDAFVRASPLIAWTRCSAPGNPTWT